MALLDDTRSPDQIDPTDYDAIYFTGGDAVMLDFPDSEGVQRTEKLLSILSALRRRDVEDDAELLVESG